MKAQPIPKEDVRHCLVFDDWPECVPNGAVLAMGEAFLDIMKGTIDYSEVIYSPEAKRRVIHRKGDVLPKLRRGIARRADDCGPLFLIALREDREDMFTLSKPDEAVLHPCQARLWHRLFHAQGPWTVSL